MVTKNPESASKGAVGKRRSHLPEGAECRRNLLLVGSCALWTFAVHHLLSFISLFVVKRQFWYLSWTLSAFAILAVIAVTIGGIGGRLSKNPRGWILILLIPLSMVVALSLQTMFGTNLIDIFGRSSQPLARSVFLVGIGWFLAGGLLQYGRLARSSILALFSFGVLVACISVSLGTNFMVEYGAVGYGLEEFQSNHLGTSTGFSFIALAAYCSAVGRFRIIIAVVSIAALFALGGRATMYLFTATLAICSIFASELRQRALSVFAVVVVGMLIIWGFAGDSDDTSRMWLFSGVMGGGSAAGRAEAMRIGLSTLEKQLAYGAPEAIVENAGNLGAYMHNLLSAIQFFGLIPFLLLAAAAVLSLRFAFKVYRNSKRSIDLLGIHLLVLSCLEVSVAKSVHYSLFWSAIGFWLFRIAGLRQVLPGSKQ